MAKTRRPKEMPVREYARALGAVLVLIGVAGLVLGERSLPGVMIVVVPKGLAHLLMGGLLTCVGLVQTDEELARTAIVALGVVYLLVGVLGFVLPTLLGPLPYGYSVGENAIHLVVGLLNLAVAFVSGRSSTAKV
jgi:hypothetical protein